MQPQKRTRIRDLASDHQTYQHYYLRSRTKVSTGEITHSNAYEGEVELLHHDGSETTDDIVTPNFHKLMLQGDIINNPYHNTKIINDYGCIYLRRENAHAHGSLYTYTSKVLDVIRIDTLASYPASMVQVPELSQSESALRSIALTRAWAKVSAASAESLVTIGESKKTVSMFISLFRRAARLLRGYRKKRRLFARGLITLSSLLNAWLEVRYGLRPIYYEVKAHIEALNETLNGTQRTCFRAFAEDEAKDERLETNSALGGYLSHVGKYKLSAKRKITVSAGVLVEAAEQDRTLGLQIADNFGLFDISQTAWELFPYSFVVDWFINVGDYIAAYSPKLDVNPVASWSVVTRESIQTVEMTDYDPKPYQLYNDPSIYYLGCLSHSSSFRPQVLRTVEKQRYSNPDLPLIPSINIRLDVLKLIDLLALIKQLR